MTDCNTYDTWLLDTYDNLRTLPYAFSHEPLRGKRDLDLEDLKQCGAWRLTKETVKDLRPTLPALGLEDTDKEAQRIKTDLNALYVLERLDRDPSFKKAFEANTSHRAENGSSPFPGTPSSVLTSLWNSSKLKQTLDTKRNDPAEASLWPDYWFFDPQLNHATKSIDKDKYTKNVKYNCIGELLQTNSVLTIPCYQRQYEWDTANIQQLFDDLISIDWSSRRPLFLGTLLLQKVQTGDGNLVLDGQQRLITFNLVLIWFCQLFCANGRHAWADEILANWLGHTRDSGRTFSPRLTPDPRDAQSWHTILSKSATTADKWRFPDATPTTITRTTIEDRYSDIADIFGAHIAPAGIIGSTDEVLDMLLRLVKHAWVLTFTLNDEDDPYDTFERLNVRGKRLQNADLIKAKVLSRMKPQAALSFYTDKWDDFEGFFKDADDKRTNSFQFTKSLLDQYYTTYAKLRIPGARKATTVMQLATYWDNKKAKTILADLNVYARFYKLIVLFDTKTVVALQDGLGKEIMGTVWVLSRLGIPDEMRPFITALLHNVYTQRKGKCTKTKANDILRVLSGWILRHAMIARGSLQGLAHVFGPQKHPRGPKKKPEITFWDWFKSTSYDISSLLSKIDRPEFGCGDLTDEALKERLSTDKIYDTKRAGITIALLIAQELDKTPFKLRAGEADDRISAITIEHLLPQTRPDDENPHYPHWKHVQEKSHHAMKHTIGNLFLLNPHDNTTVGQQGPEEKATHFEAYSNFSITRALLREISTAKWKKKHKGLWDKLAIESRTKRIIKISTQWFEFPAAKMKGAI
jgi:hypothetical protein